MKHITLFLTISVLFSLLIGSVGVFAQAPEPPERFPLHEREYQPPEYDRDWLSDGKKPFSRPYSAGSQNLAPTIALGQPGLSFRYVDSFGITEEPYPADVLHINGPTGLYIDGGDNLFITSDRGSRVLKYNSSGSNVLSLGKAGVLYTGDYVFVEPNDVALDGSGKIWVAVNNRVVQYNSSGTFQQNLPEEDPWISGDDNTHFDNAHGIAFDSAGSMYVSDSNNHRIQVYTFAGGKPVYNDTIGVTGVSGSDNNHFNNPERLAMDTSNRLYVVDYGNDRVQRCTKSGTWSCSTFASGLNDPRGIDLDSSGNVFITDPSNSRILKCSSAGVCSNFVTGLPGYTVDVAVDSSSNVYASDTIHHAIRKYNSSGVSLGTFVGVLDMPYTIDTVRYNDPQGVATHSDGSIYITERNGYRVAKLDAVGTQLWVRGQAGIYGNDNLHFGSWWSGPNDVDVKSNGDVYIADTGNHRIQIYTSGGSYKSTLGSYGSGNYQFIEPYGIYIDKNDNLYLADRYNHRVQIYDNNQLYVATLGETGVSGSDNDHFDGPGDVAVDSMGNIYVADTWNQRVQVFDSSYNYQRTLGTTAAWGDDFDHFSEPWGLAIDASDRVYVADAWNDRVQVYNKDGKYLTTIGGQWGLLSSQFRGAMSVDVDSAGNVYIADRTNHRIQKFAPGVPDWAQVNINGFGDMTNGNIHTLAGYNGQLYAGTYNDNGAQMWRMSPGGPWTQAVSPGFGDVNTIGINHLVSFNSQLYAGARNDVDGALIYRSTNGSVWSPVVSDGLTDPGNFGAYRIAVFNGQIYAGTGNWTTPGGQIWRSLNGNAGTWGVVVSNGFDDPDNYIMRSSEIHNGYLYFGTQNIDTTTVSSTNGGIVIRSNTGNSGSWTKVINNGFGDTNNYVISGLTSFNGYLYASTGSWFWDGIQVWRCQVCASQSDWQLVVDNGFGNPDNWGFSTLQTFDGMLYLVIGNGMTGMEVWRSSTGNSGDWTQISSKGFGDSENDYPYYNNVTEFNGNLYIGTENNAHGPEIWEFLHEWIFLPLIMR